MLTLDALVVRFEILERSSARISKVFGAGQNAAVALLVAPASTAAPPEPKRPSRKQPQKENKPKTKHKQTKQKPFVSNVGNDTDTRTRPRCYWVLFR